jgi:HSP20 family protein
MSIIKRNPTALYSHRDEFLTSIDRVFDGIFNQMFPIATKEFGIDTFSKGSYPKVNIVDNESNVVIEAEIPGLTKEQVNLEVQSGVLTIMGEKRENKEEGLKKDYIYRELKQSSFKRSFQLNDNLDTDKIDAKFENGILEITIPKKISDTEANKTKLIDIK